MTFDRIWRQAAETFGVGAGQRVALSPFSRTWSMVSKRAEHAVWEWNGRYGPLTQAQREYAADLVCSALIHARKAPTAGDRYAWFNARLTYLLNHELVHAGFRRRVPADVDQGLDVGDLLEVPV